MKNETKEIRYIELFGGIGGFRLGIEKVQECSRNWRGEKSLFRGISSSSIKEPSNPNEQRSWNCVGYYEIDKYAVQTYNKNFNTNYKPSDIRDVAAESVPDHDVLTAGFPCQSFSIAGRRKGFEDTRGTLFFEICRIAKAKRPRLLFLENVKGLLNHDETKTFATILRTLDELGYDAEWDVLNSKHFGVPQNRERVFIIGHLRGEPFKQVFPLEEGYKFNVSMGEKTEEEQERISNALTSIYYKRNYGGTQIMQEPKIAERTPLKFMSRNQKEVEGDYSFTIDGANTGGIKQGRRIRRLTPLECERLQGFPDNWTQGVSDTQRYKQLGNAVTTNVIEAIVRNIRL